MTRSNPTLKVLRDRLRHVLQTTMRERKMKHLEMAYLVGVSDSAVCNILNGRNQNLETMVSMVTALGYDVTFMIMPRRD